MTADYDIMPNRPSAGKSRLAAVIDFTERVGSTAFLAGYATYIALPHTSTSTDVHVALVAAAGSALKYVAKRVAVWQAANIGA